MDGMLAAGEHVRRNKEKVKKAEKEEKMIDFEIIIMKKEIN